MGLFKRKNKSHIQRIDELELERKKATILRVARELKVMAADLNQGADKIIEEIDQYGRAHTS